MTPEDAAKIADMYAEVNFQMGQDTILLDPILSGKGVTPENLKRSEERMMWGCIFSARAHAAQDIAAAIRKASQTKGDGKNG